ncbi:peptidylprolyl isomerase [Tahibacter harae]|uniref:peptidylprolyl isomerase n=1 Tax=Tahibacter harae TaxID=2963937 RepID=A0ABT1QPY9_9GAMM|nr:peptidylprolyl isomerase [Tahibacter harae]MCQ4164348.1 peptidylprolyl isomerase [Tahibacter harae]
MHKLLFALGLALSTTAAFAAEAKPEDQVLITQGEVKLTMADVDAYVARIPAADRAGFMAKPERIQTMLRNMLLDRQLAAEARKLGLDKDPLVQRQIGLATDSTLGRVRTQKLLESLKVPDFSAQAEEEYLANKSKYSVPARVDVKHILIGDKTRTPEEAAALAQDTLAKVTKNPAQFDALVESLSDDPSKKDNHGLIENATSSQLVRPFAEASGKLAKPGDLSPVVKTTFGYHIIRAESITPAKPRPYEQVRENIIASLTKEWTEKQMRGHIDELRNMRSEENAELLLSLRDRYRTAGASVDATAVDAGTESDKVE